jgi:hypothetical protein
VLASACLAHFVWLLQLLLLQTIILLYRLNRSVSSIFKPIGGSLHFTSSIYYLCFCNVYFVRLPGSFI